MLGNETIVDPRYIASFINDLIKFKGLFSKESKYKKIKLAIIKAIKENFCFVSFLCNLGNFVSNTISLHRKKQTNSLYTINALNAVIRSLNNGVLDKSFTIEWENFQNTLLLTNENGLQKIVTKIHTVVNTRNWEESHFNR